MAVDVDLPSPMLSPESGEPLLRGSRPFLVTYKGEGRSVELPGYYPEGPGEAVHVGDDLKGVDEALHVLKQQIDGIASFRLSGAQGRD